VKPSSELDPCLSSKEKVTKRLKSLVLGEGNRLNELLRRGYINEAAQLAMTVLKTANAKTDCGETLNQLVKTLVSVDFHE